MAYQPLRSQHPSLPQLEKAYYLDKVFNLYIKSDILFL